LHYETEPSLGGEQYCVVSGLNNELQNAHNLPDSAPSLNCHQYPFDGWYFENERAAKINKKHNLFIYKKILTSVPAKMK